MRSSAFAFLATFGAYQWAGMKDLHEWPVIPAETLNTLFDAFRSAFS